MARGILIREKTSDPLCPTECQIANLNCKATREYFGASLYARQVRLRPTVYIYDYAQYNIYIHVRVAYMK